MKNIKKITKISIVLLVLITSSMATAKIYKWTDEKGVVHYTQRPAPVGKEATDIERKIRIAADLPTASLKKNTPLQQGKYGKLATVDAKPKPKSDAKEEDTTAKTSEDEHAENSNEEYEKKLREYCKKQTANLQALNSDTPIAWQDEGKTQLLSNDERKGKIDAIEKSLQDNCSPKKDAEPKKDN